MQIKFSVIYEGRVERFLIFNNSPSPYLCFAEKITPVQFLFWNLVFYNTSNKIYRNFDSRSIYEFEQKIVERINS